MKCIFKLASTLIVIALLLTTAGCGQHPLKVIRSQGTEGVVIVTQGIGTDGNVLYATGKGADSLLVRAAEENARTWTFQVPAHARFPLEHEIRYTFKFDKQGGPNLTPTIVTDLPNAVEIIGTPAGGDHVILIPPHGSKKSHSSVPKAPLPQ